jgi:hypothetical protein
VAAALAALTSGTSDLKLLAYGSLADGGTALRRGMRAGGIDTAGMTLNPVDLKRYRDQGLHVPNDTART